MVDNGTSWTGHEVTLTLCTRDQHLEQNRLVEQCCVCGVRKGCLDPFPDALTWDQAELVVTARHQLELAFGMGLELAMVPGDETITWGRAES